MPKLPTGKQRLVSRNVRADLAMWERAQKIADEQGETMSDVVRRAVWQYVKKHEKKSA